jgi:WD40 repeat protein
MQVPLQLHAPVATLAVVVITIIILTFLPLSHAQQQSSRQLVQTKPEMTAVSQKPELYVQTGHSDFVGRVAYSRDGKLIASLSSDKSIKLWDEASGQEQRTLRGSGFIRSFAFSPNGTELASIDEERVIRFWNLRSGKEVRELKSQIEAVRSLEYSADGRMLVAVGGNISIEQWDAAKGQLLGVKTLPGHSSKLSSAALSPDGQILATGAFTDAGYSVISLWDLASGRELHQLESFVAGSGPVAVAFSPNGKTLAASGGNTISLWDVESGTKLNSLRMSMFFYDVVFTPDGKSLLSCGGNLIHILDASSLRIIKTVKGHSPSAFAPYYVAVRPDGAKFAHGDGKTIVVWDLASALEDKVLKGHAGVIRALAFSDDGKTIASANEDAVRIWNLAERGELKYLKGNADYVTNLAFGPNNKTLVSDGVFGEYTLWDPASGQQLRALRSNVGVDGSMAFSSNGIIAGGNFGQIVLWDSSGNVLRQFGDGSNEPMSVALSPDGKTLARGVDKRIALWDVASGKELWSLQAHEKNILKVTFSPDGGTLASLADDNTIKLWNAASGHEVRTLNNSSHFLSVAFSPDGTLLVGGDSDGLVKFWDASSGRELRTFRAHPNDVNAVAFSPDGKMLATGGKDGTIRLWDVKNGGNLASLIALDEHDWVVATEGGRFDGSDGGIKHISYIQETGLIPLESFFDQFYTPRLLQRVYAHETPTPTSSAVDFSKRIKLPPLVRIISPKAGAVSDSDAAEIVVRATDQGGGVEDLRLYQNGKLVSDETRQLEHVTGVTTRRFNIALLPGVNTFRATAFNADRTEAVPDEIQIDLKAIEASSNLYILAVGLNEYKNTRYSLNYGHADAEAFADAIEQRGHGIFKEIKKRVIFDSDATRANIQAAFSQIIKQARPQDAFVFYYAGHGVMSEGDDSNPPDFYLVPYEVVRIYGDDGSLMHNGIAARTLRDMLKNIRAQKQLIVIDACQSGGAVETISMRGASEEKAILQLARSAGVTVLASAGQDQVATEFGKLHHGVFTYALLKGLSGEADGSPHDGKVTVKELEAYISDQVPELTKLYRGKRQDPNSWTRGQDFPIATN